MKVTLISQIAAGLAIVGLSLGEGEDWKRDWSDDMAMRPRRGCSQYLCPDTPFGVDMIAQWIKGIGWTWSLRWDECGCEWFWMDQYEVEEGKFALVCNNYWKAPRAILVKWDWRNKRGWWEEGDKRVCYRLEYGDLCKERNIWGVWPVEEIACDGDLAPKKKEPKKVDG